jgi:hypothetical protein
MAGLAVAINVLAAHTDADRRDKPAHDGDIAQDDTPMD